MNNEPTQWDLDRLAEIIWWMKGYKAGAKGSLRECPFNDSHLESLETIMEYMRSIHERSDGNA